MSDLTIRPLDGRADFLQCVRLQEVVWGEGFDERVPPAILEVARTLGGVATGAFDGGELVGFVFGLTGLRDGRLEHWSDMLAVHPRFRGRGIGLRLKLDQRRELLERGVTRAGWTFDPLEARNATLNLNRLGAVGARYREDVYGSSTSPLHSGIGTDRLVVQWDLGNPLPRGRLDLGPRMEAPGVVQLLEPLPRGSEEALVAPGSVRSSAELSGSGPAGKAGGHPPPVTIAVPADLQELKARDTELARAWRTATRTAFGVGLREGRVVVGGAYDPLQPVYRYLLSAAVPGNPVGTPGDLEGNEGPSSASVPPPTSRSKDSP